MGKSEEMLRMQSDMNGQPELKEKLELEIKRILEVGEAENDGEAMVKAASALGYTITLEEMERFTADSEQLDVNELDAVSGGFFTDCTSIFVCDESYFFDGKPPERTRPIMTNPIRSNPIVKDPNKKIRIKRRF